MLVDEVGGDVDEDRDNEEEDDDQEPGENGGIGAAEVVADNLREVRPVVAKGGHAAKEVMDGACENAADRDDKEGDLAELDAGDDTDDGTDAGDVEELDQQVLPLWKRDVVDPVGVLLGGRWPVVRPDNFLDKFAVSEIARD